MAAEVISMQVLLGPKVMSTSCADVAITLLRGRHDNVIALTSRYVTSGCMAPEVISIQNGGAR